VFRHLGGRVAERTGERSRSPKPAAAHEADDRMAVTRTGRFVSGRPVSSATTRGRRRDQRRVSSARHSRSLRRAPWVHRSAHASRSRRLAGGTAACVRVSPRRSNELAASSATSAAVGADAPVGPVEESGHAVTGHPGAASTFGPGVTQLHELDVELCRVSSSRPARLASALGPDRPVRSSSASIAFLRCEKLPQHLGGQSPRASDRPRRSGTSHWRARKPSSRDSDSRSSGAIDRSRSRRRCR